MKVKRRRKKTCLIRSGSEMRQRALQSGSRMSAPKASSWVARPPSMTKQPPALSMSSSTVLLLRLISSNTLRACAKEDEKGGT